MERDFITRDEMLSIPSLEISDPIRLVSEPLVSVVVITYNHEAFIEENIRGVLDQKCDFPIELIIGEDKSKDRTLDICLEYQRKYPEMIRIITWRENIGGNANFFRVLGRSRGKYIATCEGDDYWTDPAKLSKQVALMERSPHASLCGARTREIVEMPTGKAVDTVIGPDKLKMEYSLTDALRTYLFHTSSFMFRSSLLFLPHCMRSLDWYDWFVQCISARNGPVVYLPEIMSVYRRHAGGWYGGSSQDVYFDKYEAVCKALVETLDESHSSLARHIWDVVQSERCHYLLNAGRTSEARVLSRGLMSRLATHQFWRAMLLLSHLLFPVSYAILRDLSKKSRVREVLLSR